MSSISAKDAVPGQRLSLDPDGNGRVVAYIRKWRGMRRIVWEDGSETEFRALDKLFVIEQGETA